MKPPSEWRIPDFMLDLPDHTMLKSSELSDIFGCNKNSLSNFSLGHDGYSLTSVPKADGFIPRKNRPGEKVYFWRLGTIRKWIREHQ